MRGDMLRLVGGDLRTRTTQRPPSITRTRPRERVLITDTSIIYNIYTRTTKRQ